MKSGEWENTGVKKKEVALCIWQGKKLDFIAA